MALGGAPFALAEAGLLTAVKSVVHWKSRDAFTEKFSGIDIEDSLFVDDGTIACCAGEAATLDLITDFIRQSISSRAAEQVCDHFLIAQPRQGSELQPGSRGEGLRGVPPRVQHIAGIMTDHVEEPLDMAQLARSANLSVRQVQRLFRKHVGQSPSRYYLQLRLARAQQLLMATDLTVSEIALACGFTSFSYFTKQFRKQFGANPSAARERPTDL